MQTAQSLPNIDHRGVFDLMNINELSLSVPATVGRPLSCRTGAELLTSDRNPSVVTRTFIEVLSAFKTPYTSAGSLAVDLLSVNTW